MLELGQPLHAFDADTIRGESIIVRRARSGEQLTTLDGVERSLDAATLVIADAERAVAIAGVMGGAATEITSATHNVFLESAWFQPLSVRRTARSLGMNTEASYRFERGADIEMAPYACNRAAAMIVEICGGEVVGNLSDAYPGRRKPAHAVLRRDRIVRVLGAAVEDTAVERIFSRLEFPFEKTTEGWRVAVPSFRVDIATEEDLLEEIARHHGYDNFPYTLPASRAAGALLPREVQVRHLRDALAAAGYSEIATYSFSDASTEMMFYPDIEPVRLRNPMSEDASVMRTSLLPSMLKTVQRNLNRSLRHLQFYELGKIYGKHGERPALILAACGNIRTPSVHDPGREFSFFDLKGDVEELLETMGVACRWSSDNASRYHHPGRFARVGHLARLGELHPDYAAAFKIKPRVYIAEIEIDMLLSAPAAKPVTVLPRFPAVKRDLSLLLDKGTQYASVEQTISGAGIAELVRIEPFDLLLSGPFPEGKYSLSVSLTYQSADRTLTDVEVEDFDRRVLNILATRLGAQLRT
jgi:phenylalanyl-tRNA synthetase beta chain